MTCSKKACGNMENFLVVAEEGKKVEAVWEELS